MCGSPMAANTAAESPPVAAASSASSARRLPPASRRSGPSQPTASGTTISAPSARPSQHTHSRRPRSASASVGNIAPNSIAPPSNAAPKAAADRDSASRSRAQRGSKPKRFSAAAPASASSAPAAPSSSAAPAVIPVPRPSAAPPSSTAGHSRRPQTSSAASARPDGSQISRPVSGPDAISILASPANPYPAATKATRSANAPRGAASGGRGGARSEVDRSRVMAGVAKVDPFYQAGIRRANT